MSSSESSSDYTSNTEGASVRNLRWSRSYRRRIYRAWPPTNLVSYPISKRHTIYRHLVEHIGVGTAASGSTRSGADYDELDTPEDRLVRDRWRELADQKIRIYAIRSRIKETSAEIKEAREVRDQAENRFMSAAQPVLIPVAATAQMTLHMRDLPSLFQDMQEKRETCREFEESLEKFEDELKHAQDGLDLLERRLINELRNPVEAGATREPLRLGMSPLPQSDLLLCLEIEPDKTTRRPEFRWLMRVWFEFNNARQERMRLFAEKNRIEERKDSYSFFEQYHPAALQHIKPLQDQELQFLDNFDLKKRSILDVIRRLREEVRARVQICWKMNIIPRHISLFEAQSWFPGDFSIDEDLKNPRATATEWTENTTSTTTAHFSILLSNPASHLLGDFPLTAKAALRKAKAALRAAEVSSPEHLQIQSAITAAAKEVDIQNLTVETRNESIRKQSKFDFINGWMLQTLRTSIHEVETLYSFYLHEGPPGVLDTDEWQESVLRNWFDDEGDAESLSQQSKTSETTSDTAPPTAPSWLSDPFSGSFSWYGSDDEGIIETAGTEMVNSKEDLEVPHHAAPEWPTHVAPGPDDNDLGLESDQRQHTLDAGL